MFLDLCPPALTHLVFGIITLISGYATFSPLHFVSLFIWILIATYILNLICNKGYKWLSWLLVFLPYLIVFVLFFFLIKKDEKNHKHKKVIQSTK